MPRYIDAEKLLCAIHNQHTVRKFFPIKEDKLLVGILDIIYKQPTADVEEVKHGEWNVYRVEKKFIRCTVCNSVIDCNYTHIDENEFDFCPYCGAKMDGGNKND